MKRKPSSDVTTQTLLDFDLGESSSDSDFRIEDHDDESDDFSLGSKDDDDADDDSDEDNDEDDDDDDEDEIIDDAPTDVKHKHASVSDIVVTQGIVNSLNGDSLRIIGRIEPHSVAWHSHSGCGNDLEEEEQERGKSATDKAKNAAIEKLFMTLICCACLGDRSDDQNEIVECDGCGVTVHEGCYGVSECTSTGSTISSCSTEPWFCDACKAGVLNPDCELCPNKGGIFKETDVGKWVHLVCALYVPGVAFGEVDQLSSVTLFEMPYNKWGAKTCSLCEDAKLARTGVCIGCDAGMCKTYFHVTCAQYVGLLSEAHSEEADQADPFYAHCKIHSDKSLIKHRKRNYNTIKMRAAHRQLEEAQREANKTKPSSEQIRIERKLTKHRKRYLINKEIRNPPWVPTQKMPRLLITSATACKKMLFKAQLLGLDMTAIELQEAQMASLGDVRKKWHIPAAFSVEFIGYYLDRAIRLVDMKRNLEEQLVPTNNLLLAKQRQLRECYDDSVAKNQDAVKTNESCKASITQIYNYIYALCPNKALTPVDQIGKPIPTTMSCGVLANTVSQGAATPPARRTMAVPTAAALKMGVGFPLQNLMVPGNQQDDTGRILSTQCKQAGGGEELLNECGICKRCHDQHLLAKCDTCHLHYHLGCLNPPLTRHPKKSKLYGWQCSECDKSDDSNPESIIIPKAPRKSRTRYSKDGTIVPYDLSFTLVDQAHQLPSDSMCKKNISNTCLVDRKSLENAPLSITDLELPSCSEGLPVRALIKEEPTRSVEGSSKEFACQAMSNKQPRKRGRKKKSQFTSSSTPIIDQSKQLAYDGIKAERLDVSLKNQKEFSIDLNDQRDNVKSINQENSQDLLLVKDKVGGQDKSHQRCESIPTENAMNAT
ncbi:PHD finger protein 14 [Anopheles nili]|uniref:PHD finger protein 14 n=1 Tax=Anopheles nili TaxID=185578 RepID=UPI00237B5CD3|nr:PHD finger protein 14 [Anopheles nili]